jgi:hypothetical protein
MRIITTTAISASLLLTACAGISTEAAARPDGESGSVSVTAAPAGAASDENDCPNPYGGACLGLLQAGSYETSVFEPTLAYTAPDDTWANLEDLPGNFLLLRPQDPQDGALGGSYIGVYQDVRAPALNCDEAWEPGVGHTPEELVEFYQGVPGLEVSMPVAVSVGGLHGYQIDLSLKSKDALCNYGGLPSTPIIIGNGVSDLHHVVAQKLDLRLILLSWKRGNVAIEITNVQKQYPAAKWRALVQPIVDSFQFS